MPALTPQLQLRRHNLLQLLWLEASTIFTILTPKEQWEIHRCYRPSEHLTETELTEHLAEIRKTEPSLTNRAGKHFALIDKVYRFLQEHEIPLSDHETISRIITPLDPRRQRNQLIQPDIPRHSGTPGKYVFVRPLMRPEPDLKRLSRALVALVREREEKAKAEATDSPSHLPPGSDDDARAA
ncbi:MAG TPA: hypothetical protein VNR36_08180 [Pseudolysinimonas sp.]|nr:hypothetical protein [Pseudolysinimonas sp.]